MADYQCGNQGQMGSDMGPPPLPNNNLNPITKVGKIIPNRIFLGGLTSDTTEKDLQSVFSEYGKIRYIKIIYDHKGMSRGYGFVTFDKVEDALRLQSENVNITIRNNRIKISKAVKKQNILDVLQPQPMQAPGNPMPPRLMNPINYGHGMLPAPPNPNAVNNPFAKPNAGNNPFSNPNAGHIPFPNPMCGMNGSQQNNPMGFGMMPPPQNYFPRPGMFGNNHPF